MNKWFDEECKEMRKRLKNSLGTSEERQLRAIYRSLLRKKRRDFIWTQQKKLADLFLKKPKAFWQAIKPKTSSITGYIEDSKWDDYLQHLYHKGNKEESRNRSEIQYCFRFTQENVTWGIKKLAGGKASDTLGWMAECLKWAGEPIIPFLVFMFNAAQEEGFPKTWQENLVVPIYKARDPDIPNNYRTIMVSSLMAKLYSIILEREISVWAEQHEVRAISQAGFRSQHSTLDHLLTLRALIEQNKDLKRTTFCCFVDFEKAFDTVPRDLLWQRLFEVGIPRPLIHATRELYGQVVGIMKASSHEVSRVVCDIGVKQGCPSSPTLFGLYIDKLEQ